MAEVRLEKTVAAPIDAVFEALSDHEGYTRFRGITEAELVSEGHDERNGIGAVRRIASGPIHFEEEITAFERPARMDYLITSVNLPLDHDGGSIRLEAAGDATRVRWDSSFTAPVPVVGGALGALMAAVLERSFARLLDEIERLDTSA